MSFQFVVLANDLPFELADCAENSTKGSILYVVELLGATIVVPGKK